MRIIGLGFGIAWCRRAIGRAGAGAGDLLAFFGPLLA
jgi:hypothetical protein